jgi:hypothetical protein
MGTDGHGRHCGNTRAPGCERISAPINPLLLAPQNFPFGRELFDDHEDGALRDRDLKPLALLDFSAEAVGLVASALNTEFLYFKQSPRTPLVRPDFAKFAGKSKMHLGLGCGCQRSLNEPSVGSSCLALMDSELFSEASPVLTGFGFSRGHFGWPGLTRRGGGKKQEQRQKWSCPVNTGPA